MDRNTQPSIGVAVITHNSKRHLQHCLPPLLQSPLNPRVLVVNSSSQDGTVEEAKRLGAETLVVPRHEFNHGTTRELARHHLGTEIAVMITPDAYATDNRLLNKLLTPLIDGQASIAYARQIPHKGADFFESFSREFNYPDTSHSRGIEDTKKFGVYTFFCSNSCCAWLNSALDEIGGFQHVLLGEDTVAVGKLLQKGHRISYVAEAVVHHSHRYTLWQEFQRHYDTGLARKEFQTLLKLAGSDSARGKAYTRALFSQLIKRHPTKVPYALLQILIKLLGYQVGRYTTKAPRLLKQSLSSQDFFWKNQLFKK